MCYCLCNKTCAPYIVSNGSGVFISDIVKGGAADLDGRLIQGDQILSVNGEDVRQASQEVVATILKVSEQYVLNCSVILPSVKSQSNTREQLFIYYIYPPHCLGKKQPRQFTIYKTNMYYRRCKKLCCLRPLCF